MRLRLMWMSLALSACGLDHPTADPNTMPTGLDPSAPTVGANDEPPIDELQPHVCAVHAWTTPHQKADDLVLSVAALPHGAALLTVPSAGGPLTAFEIDEGGHLLGNQAGTGLLRGPFDRLTATFVDGRLLATVGGDGQSTLVAIRPDLHETVGIGKLGDSLAGDVPVTDVRQRHVAPLATRGGIFFQPFDLQWREQPRELAVLDDITEFAALPYGTDEAMLAWSTPDSCNAMNLASGRVGSHVGACKGLAGAADPVSGTGELVYQENTGAIRALDLRAGAQDLVTAVHPVAVGSSPRIKFDGGHYWVSFVDTKGDVVVGILDDEGRFHSGGALYGLTPGPQAHQLATIDGQVWLFTVDHRGFVGYEMCL